MTFFSTLLMPLDFDFGMERKDDGDARSTSALKLFSNLSRIDSGSLTAHPFRQVPEKDGAVSVARGQSPSDH
jgi:hypothetical protein